MLKSEKPGDEEGDEEGEENCHESFLAANSIHNQLSTMSFRKGSTNHCCVLA